MKTDNENLNLGDWAPHEFEEQGQKLIQLIREYFENIRETPVSTDITPKELLNMLDGPIPNKAESFDLTLDETWEKIIPHLTHWNHPSFHAYFSITASFPGILADLLISSLNVNAMVWKASPAASALEKIVLRWITEMVGYDPSSDGVLINNASLATFYALVAARDALTDLEVRTKGLTGRVLPTLRIYTSDQAHSSVDKAAIALGIGTDHAVRIPTDEYYQMIPEELEKVILSDLEKGFRPMAVVATVGTTATGSVDPLSSISDICKKHGIWLHIDAAYGGFWNVVPEIKNKSEDLQLGDSIVVNPHKCLYTPLEVTAMFCRRQGALSNSFRLVPEYLQTENEDGSIDYMDFSLQLGRSFRSLKLWWIIRSFGLEGLTSRMRRSIQLTEWLEKEVNLHPDFECVTTSHFPLLCIRYVPEHLQNIWTELKLDENEESKKYLDKLNAQIMQKLNQSGLVYLSHAVIREGYVIRISIGNIKQNLDDIKTLWDTIQKIAKEVNQDFPSPIMLK
ncbi:pyridoxal phosphate-dependent decarboxylase family protein [Chengkuizengella sp. SCS-71B]|uniref:pyridoxal phosphate-dependent decarboxylase family protein n=1 Tax=Chengkuizengella sp. SCS-71B TaxID=3115290 RepID=UPI0032C23C3D